MRSILIGVPYNLVALTDTPAATGDAVAMPARRTQLTWQTIIGTPAGSNTFTLQASNDGTTWNTLDSSTATGGEIKTVNTSAKFIRCNTTHSGGAGFQVIASCKA
jgi:hypothetical protein